MSESLTEFSTAFHAHFTRDANQRLYAGLEQDLGMLPDPSIEDAKLRQAEAEALLGQLEAVDVSALDFDDKLDLELARLKIAHELHDYSYTFNGKTKREQMPQAGDQIGDGIFVLFTNDPRPDQERLRDITSRLEQVPQFCEAMLTRLDTPLARWVAMDVEKVEGLPQLFSTIESWAEGCGYAELERLHRARGAAESSLHEYAKSLKALPTTTQLHVGNEVARSIVSMRGINTSFDELHQIARNFQAETTETLEALRIKLVEKYQLGADTSTEDLQKFLASKYRVELPTGELDDVLRHYEDERSNILAFIGERDLFPILNSQDIKIIRTPSFMEPSIPAGAMTPPPVFREGVRTSMVYLTLRQDLLDEHTMISIPSMMIHEGIPGHHLQLATASTHKSVIRRHIDSNEHAEGWTTMLEDYMLDIGYKAELADECRFCGKRDLSRIGARVAIDLFFMTGDKKFLDIGVDCDLSSEDPFVAAGCLLAAVTGFGARRVEAELNWYSQERGYPLSYLAGNKTVWALKDRLTKAQEGKLNERELDRRFHDIYLHSGVMPLRFLDSVFENAGLL